MTPHPSLVASTDEQRRPQQWRVLLAIGLLYVSFGISFGLLEFTVPPILLSRGVNLASMGWVIALYIPFGLTFLWAPLVDSWRVPYLGNRIGWIAASQGVSAVLLLVIAAGASYSAATLFILGLAVSFTVATMDLGLDALAVDLVAPAHRAMIASLKVGALAIGGVIGGGVLLGLFHQIGWKGLFIIAAIVPLISTIPVMTLSHVDAPRSKTLPRASLLVRLRRPGTVRQIVILSLFTTIVIGLVYFQRMILVELHMPLAEVGWTIGTLSPILSAIAAVAIVPMMKRFTAAKTLWCLVALCVSTNVLLAYLIPHGASNLIVVCSLAAAAICSAISVVIYALILKWAEGDQAATDYSLLCGGSRMVTTLVLMAVPPVLTHISWPAFYLGASVCLIALTAYLQPQVGKLDDTGRNGVISRK